jgi:hypothetical protein
MSPSKRPLPCRRSDVAANRFTFRPGRGDIELNPACANRASMKPSQASIVGAFELYYSKLFGAEIGEAGV